MRAYGIKFNAISCNCTMCADEEDINKKRARQNNKKVIEFELNNQLNNDQPWNSTEIYDVILKGREI